MLNLKAVSIGTIVIVALMSLASTSQSVNAGAGAEGHGHQTMERMREMHRSHAHGHDFKAMEVMSPAHIKRIMRLMEDIGLAVPPMESRRGRKLFVGKGCIVCHKVNGIGGDVGPSLNAADMPKPMNVFEFAARMWRGAPAMVALQEDQLGGFIQLTGSELADLVAFAHDKSEQKKLTASQIPERFRKAMAQ